MPSYYLSEDLARFGEMAKTNPQLFDLFLKWYTATMEPGALDDRTKKLIPRRRLRDPGALLHRLLLVGMHRRGNLTRGNVRGRERRGGHPGGRSRRALGAGVQHDDAQGLAE
jgi:hypothetical protein